MGCKETLLCSPTLDVEFSAMQAYLFVKCYSHDLEVFAGNVCGCTLDHHWTETWEDRNQDLMEPNKPVFFHKVCEMGTDNAEGPIHYTVSHNRLEIRAL